MTDVHSIQEHTQQQKKQSRDQDTHISPFGSEQHLLAEVFHRFSSKQKSESQLVRSIALKLVLSIFTLPE
jgi:hypothetical protein